MPSLADTTLEAADAVHAEMFGVPVDYVRGATTIEGVTARVWIQEYEITERGGAVTVAKMREYVIAKDDLPLTPAKPRRGDKIIETLNGVERTFQVLPISDRPCVEDDDTDGRLWRIRTKEVGS